MDDIQSWWEVPSIAHFCSLFRAAFNLLDFDIEELEEALLTDGAEIAGSSLLQELIVRLLCGCLGNNDISTFNYQMFLRRLFRQKFQDCERANPFNTDMDFQFLPLRSKVEILHALCDFRLDAEDVQDLLKNLDSDSLRVVPLGHDENNSAYWYFYGTRLYKESYLKVQKKRGKEKRRKGKDDKRHKKRGKSISDSDTDELGSGTWQVVCFTEHDWDKVTQVLRDSTSKAERSLYRTLMEDFLPEIPRLFAEKERLQRKRLMDYQPRRQSSRLEKLKQQKVEEEKIVIKKEESIRLTQQDESSKSSLSATLKENRASRAMHRSMSDCGSTYSMVDSLADSRSNKSAFKPVGRQTNNSLASATGQIVIQGKQRKLRSSQVFKQTEEDLQTGMYKILDNIKNHEDAWPFVNPVEEKYAPRYYSIIGKPMDLQRMEDKLDEGDYLSFNDFKADFKLIVDNCRQYNGTENEYTEMVGNLESAFQTAVDRYLESDPSSDEEVTIQFPTSSLDMLPARQRRRAPRDKKEVSTAEETPSSPGSIPSPLSVCSESPSFNEASQDSRLSPEFDKMRTARRATDFDKLQTSRRTPDFDKLRASKRSTDFDKLQSSRNSPDFDKLRNSRRTPDFDKLRMSRRSPELEANAVDTEESRSSTTLRGNSRSKVNNRRKGKAEEVKNSAAIEALHIATAQTLKDINKWLDGTPRYSESFSSASNSPSHFISGEDFDIVGTKIENEYRSRLKMERPSKPNSKDTQKRRPPVTKDPAKLQRRREIQRTIERLQPGKSKGNLISNMASKTKEEESSRSNLVKADVSAVKLSLGTVLASGVLGFGGGQTSHNFDESKAETTSEIIEDKVSSPSPEASQPSPELQPAKPSPAKRPKTDVVAKTKAETMPNHSAWFKAFGAPKAPATPKRRPEPEVEKPTRPARPIATEVAEVRSPPRSQEPPSPQLQPATRQRKASTGSSMSERSSFSQDLMDPLDSSPRLILDERLGGYPSAPYPSPLHRSPMSASPQMPSPQMTSPQMMSPRTEEPPKHPIYTPNGTIRVGFYQDTIQKGSPEKVCSPREQTPSYTPRYDPGFVAYQSQPQQNYDYGAMPYYDTSKPLTDQYQAARTPAPTYATPPQKNIIQKTHSTVIPVKKRMYTEMEEPVYQQPNTPNGMQQDMTLGKERMHSMQSDLMSKDRMHGMQQDLTLGKDRMQMQADLSMGKDRIHGMQPDLSMSKDRMQMQADLSMGKDRMHGMQPDLTLGKDRMHGSTMTYGGQAQAGEKMNQAIGLQQYFNMEVPQDTQQQSDGNNRGQHMGYRGAYSSAIDPMRGNLANLSHIVERYPADAPTYYSQPSSVGYSQPQPQYNMKPSSPHMQSVYSPSPDLSTLLNKPAPYSRQMTDYTMMPSKPAPPEQPAKPARKRKPKQAPQSEATGFQHYSSLKSTDQQAPIALKSVVPGSAFNFGPAPPALGLYGDKDSYPNFLEDYRTPPSGYYMPEPTRDKAAQQSNPSPFPFLSHPQPRPPSYPQLAQAFMNHHQPLMDTTSYQQYFQRHQEELLRHSNSPMVLHQGLLAPPTGYPPGYHPALGNMRQPYDALNRPSWL